MIEFAQEHLAKSMAAGGGLGIAKFVQEGLRQKSASSTMEAMAEWSMRFIFNEWRRGE
jgi:Rod binding domain-containing protein